MNTPGKKKLGKATPKASGASTPIRFGGGIDQRQIDMSALNISSIDDEENVYEEPPKMALAREKVIEEARKVLDARGEADKRGVSLVVIGKGYRLTGQFLSNTIYQAMLMPESRR